MKDYRFIPLLFILNYKFCLLLRLFGSNFIDFKVFYYYFVILVQILLLLLVGLNFTTFNPNLFKNLINLML